MRDKRVSELMNQYITDVFVEQPVASPGSVKNSRPLLYNSYYLVNI